MAKGDQEEQQLSAQDDIDLGVKQYIDAAAAMGLTLSEEEVAEKRQELELLYHGEVAVRPEGDYATFEDAVKAAGDDIVIPEDFEKVDNKDELISVPFFITNFWFQNGEMGDFVVIRGITRGNRKIVVTDGGTGIFAQLKKLALSTGKTANVMVRGGLRKSEYRKEVEPDKFTSASTYYLVFGSS
jgi:hypothetical protein